MKTATDEIALFIFNCFAEFRVPFKDIEEEIEELTDQISNLINEYKKTSPEVQNQYKGSVNGKIIIMTILCCFKKYSMKVCIFFGKNKKSDHLDEINNYYVKCTA